MIDPTTLPCPPNVYWLGQRDYSDLPALVKGFDVCLMPFALNEATQYINPTKGLEYMATGKPVISTPVRDVVRQWSDIVRVARTADEFISAAENALKAPDRQRLARGLELAQKSSWENTVESMQLLIKEAIGKNERRSKTNIAPLSEAELSYQYQHTPGS